MTIPFPLECIVILILANITNAQNVVKHLAISRDLMRILEDDLDWFIRINLQILIISWWLGAATALLSFLLPIYTHHIIVGGIGWSIISISCIIYNL